MIILLAVTAWHLLCIYVYYKKEMDGIKVRETKLAECDVLLGAIEDDRRKMEYALNIIRNSGVACPRCGERCYPDFSGEINKEISNATH